MKKITALLLVLVMLLGFSACGNPYKNLSDEQLTEMVDKGELGTITAFYSVENVDRDDDEIIVQFDSVFKDYSFYSDKGTTVKFFGKKVIYDAKGREIDEKDLNYGDMLVITYDCKTYGDNPVTIKAVKVNIEGVI